MATRIGLWARLMNGQRTIYLASGDWERILLLHGHLASNADARWSEAEQTWRWTAEEASVLSDALVAGGGRQCVGSLVTDVRIGEHVSGTGHELLADGLIPERRTKKLIDFLREGSFRWRFVTGPIQIVTGKSTGRAG